VPRTPKAKRQAPKPAKTIPPGFISYLDPVEVERPPSGESWAHEIKWDGYRAQAHLTAGRATVYTREINCSCETFWDGGMKVWIGDTVNGHHAETMFSRENMRQAGAMVGWRGDT
jgi:ATP-dependent DNA ligase